MCSVNNLYESIGGKNVCDRFGVQECPIDNFQAYVITELYFKRFVRQVQICDRHGFKRIILYLSVLL